MFDCKVNVQNHPFEWLRNFETCVLFPKDRHTFTFAANNNWGVGVPNNGRSHQIRREHLVLIVANPTIPYALLEVMILQMQVNRMLSAESAVKQE